MASSLCVPVDREKRVFWGFPGRDMNPNPIGCKQLEPRPDPFTPKTPPPNMTSLDISDLVYAF